MDAWTKLWLSEDGHWLWIQDQWFQVSEDGKSVVCDGVSRLVAHVIEEFYPEVTFASIYPGVSRTVPSTSVMNTYNKGLDRLIAFLGPHPEQAPDLNWLRELAEYRRHELLWATYGLDRRRDGQYAVLSIEPGTMRRGLLLAVPAGHPLVTQRPPTAPILQVSTRTDLELLEIWPYQMTDIWAGIFLVHELVHLENRATGKEPREPNRTEYLDGEVRAFAAEIRAVELLSGNRYNTTIIGLRHLFASAQADASDPESWWERYERAVASETQELLNCGAALSDHEGANRRSHNLIAIEFSLAAAYVDPTGMPARLRQVVEREYESLGVLPPE